MAGAFRLVEVDGDFELRTGSILRAAELRHDGTLVPRDTLGTWTLRTREGSQIRVNVREHWLDFRLIATCSAYPYERVVAPGIPRWLGVLAVVPALLALPNLCMGWQGCCGMVIPFGLASLNRGIALRRWSVPSRAALIATLTLAWLGLQIAVVVWAFTMAHARDATTDAALRAGAVGACVGTYEVAVGPAASASSPYLADYLHEGEQMPAGNIAAELTSRRADGLGICRVRMGLYRHAQGVRTILIRQPAVELPEPVYSYFRSWRVLHDGDYEVIVSDDVSGGLLASQRFRVATSPVAAPATVPPCVGSYESVIGPAASADSPYLAEHLDPGEHLHAGGYVALELTPIGATHFPACRMRFALYADVADGRRVVVESERDMSTSEGVFNKAWLIRGAGDFEIVVTDVSTGARLAREPLTVD